MTSQTDPGIVKSLARFATFCCVLSVGLGLFALLEWALHAPSFKTILPGHVAVKANAAVGFVLLGLLASAGSGGQIARRLFPAAITVPIIIAWLCWKGQIVGLYSEWTGLALMTVAAVILLAGVAVWNAFAIDRSDGQREEAEQARRTSDERFRLLLDGVREYAIYMLDPEGRVISWNSGAASIKGYWAEEILGKDFSCFYTPTDRENGKPQRELREAISKGRFEDQGERVRKDGSVFWANVVICPMRDEAGNLRGFSKVVSDITDRKLADDQLRQSNARSRFALETAKLGSWELNLTTLRATRSLLHDQIFGYQLLMPEWSFDIFLGHVHPDDRGRVHDTFQSCVSQGKRWEFECRIICPNGEMRWIWACGDSYRELSGDATHMFGIVENITERKHAEAEVLRLNNELEQRVIQRTAALEAANKELEAFTYSVSHDLRAPLRHISGFSNILMKEFGSTLPADALLHLQRIEDGTHRMGVLVDDLLNLARMGRRDLSLQVAGLKSVVEEVVGSLQPDVAGRQVEWKIGNLPYVECDTALLKQVFQNLLSNALKFTRPRPQAVIEVGQEEKNGAPAIYVRDNGVGFSMKYADKLFGVFQRLHRVEDFEGTGVGLATVQRIIQKHGGRVWAEAELDKGATFYFTLGTSERVELSAKAMAVGEKA